MRHVFLVVVVTVKMVKIGVYIYRKIKTGVPLFWTTLYIVVIKMYTVYCSKTQWEYQYKQLFKSMKYRRVVNICITQKS